MTRALTKQEVVARRLGAGQAIQATSATTAASQADGQRRISAFRVSRESSIAPEAQNREPVSVTSAFAQAFFSRTSIAECLVLAALRGERLVQSGRRPAIVAIAS